VKNTHLLYVIIFLSLLVIGCEPIVEQMTPTSKKMDSLETLTARLTRTPAINAKEICSIVYDDFLLGETSVSEAERWLKSQGIVYNVSEDRDRITWTNPEYISISLFFHENVLYGAELWKASSRPLMGQIVNGLGGPEYFYAGLADNATPVGACEGKSCGVIIVLGYPSRGVQFSTLFSTNKATIVITPDIEMEMIECFEPGKRKQFEQNRYGSTLFYSQMIQWQGFGMKVPISRWK